MKTKLRIYMVTIRAILLCDCQTWPRRVDDIKLSIADHSSNTTSINTTIIELLRRLRRLSTFAVVHHSNWYLFRAKPCDGWCQKRRGPIRTWTEVVWKNSFETRFQITSTFFLNARLQFLLIPSIFSVTVPQIMRFSNLLSP